MAVVVTGQRVCRAARDVPRRSFFGDLEHGLTVYDPGMGDDQPRYLARTVGYVDSSAIAMDKLECIDEEEQRRVTDDAHRRWRLQQQREWGKAKREILAGVERFRSNGHPDRRTMSDLRAVQRVTARIDARLTRRLDT